MIKHNFKEIENRSKISYEVFYNSFPKVNKDEITQEIILWTDSDYSITTKHVPENSSISDEIIFHNKEGFKLCKTNVDEDKILEMAEYTITNPKKVILAGASIPNLFAAKELKRKGYEVIVYEKNKNHKNEQQRMLHNKFLSGIGYHVKDDYKHTYIKLSELKDFLSKEIKIIYESDLEIDIHNEKVFLKSEELIFDYLIHNTGHKSINHNSSKIKTYNYEVLQSKKHFAGNSLYSSVEKVKKILVDLELESIIK